MIHWLYNQRLCDEYTHPLHRFDLIPCVLFGLVALLMHASSVLCCAVCLFFHSL